MDDASSRLSYRCLAGHEIAAGELEGESEIVVMDAGAEVRICRSHGCPIAIRKPAPPRAEENQ
jgi:hypothetical protein